MKYILTLLMTFCSSSLYAASALELRQAEKISLSLTGLPLSNELREKFLRGEIDHKGLAETLSKSSDFIEAFAQFWVRTLNIQSAVNPSTIKLGPDSVKIADDGNFIDWSYIGYPPIASGQKLGELTKFYNARLSGEKPPALSVKDCPDMPTLTVVAAFAGRSAYKVLGTTGMTAGGTPVQPGTEEIWSKIWELFQQYDLECGAGGIIMKPWWDPDMVTSHARYRNAPGYRVPPMIAKACGEGLKLCDLRNANSSFSFWDEISRGMTMEAPYIISHTVAEDRPFAEVLTTERTILTGSYGYFMATNRGANLWDNFPGGKYPDSANAAFTSSTPHDQKHYWVQRTAEHAGILTTPVFQLLTNGRRAKANKVYETFLCRKFTVPEGAKPDPSDANTDLTQRTYCSYCHKSLEPMAAFFNRWPQTGVNNYLYEESGDDRGMFAGQTASGAKGLAAIVVTSDDFKDCSVKRAFEFINRRKMSTFENANKVPAYFEDFSRDGNLRRLLIRMVLEPEFLAPKEH